MYCTHCGRALVFSFLLDDFLHGDSKIATCGDDTHNHPNNLIAFNDGSKLAWNAASVA